jgi:hypothetical protein
MKLTGWAILNKGMTMAYDARNLPGAWENLDDDSILKLDAGGDFSLTPASDSSVSGDQLIDVVGGISGKWEANDNKLKLSVDLRSVRLSSSSRLTRFGLTVFSFLLRFVDARDIVDDKITRLTDTDLWLESSNGKVTKFRKKLPSFLSLGRLMLVRRVPAGW